MTPIAFQDLIPDNHCFGCGPHNQSGLRIKSFWDGETAICTYQPKSHQTAGPLGYLNGGIIATLIDCHSVCTAIVDAYRREQRHIGSDPNIWYATGQLNVRYLKPTLISAPARLSAKIIEAASKKTLLHCTLSSAGQQCVEAEIVAVRVSDQWRHGR